jgi:hypothetical protein
VDKASIFAQSLSAALVATTDAADFAHTSLAFVTNQFVVDDGGYTVTPATFALVV